LFSLPGFARVVLLLAAGSAAADGLVLKMDVELKAPEAVGAAAPMFMTADQIESNAPNIVEATGSVEARQAGQNFFARWLRYDTALNTIEARDDVRLEQAALAVSGDTLNLNLTTYKGELTKPAYQLPITHGRGAAERIDFIDQTHFSLDDATYTTCPVDNDDWFLKVGTLDIDKSRNIGTAYNATMRFLGAPILYTPWMDFPLNNARKSGVLAPTFGITERSGIDIMLPYYLNLAPNYDATLYPRLLSKRGLLLGGEFRYLLGEMQGVNRVDYLANDRVDDRSRWNVVLNNQYQIAANTQAGILYNRVSDDDYYRDFSNLIAVTSTVNLDQEIWIKTQGANWSAEARAQQFQTLQDSTATTPIIPPYSLLPQAKFVMSQGLGYGMEFNFDAQATRFTHSTLIEGTRVQAHPTLRMPLVLPYGFITPKIGWYGSYYALDDSVPEQRVSINLPSFSVDSGIAFDRPFQFAGADYEQTLEPRAYYVYVPYQNQDAIPVFDTALMDFSYAQIFTENQFVGGDRVSNANQLTLAVTSRFTEAVSGLERMQITLGQRYYFSDQRVTLPGTPPSDSNATDLIAAIGGQITPEWRIDAAWQFGTQNSTTTRQNFGASYRPAPGSVLNFGYRFIDQTTNQVDLSGQWPLTDRLHGMFRYNYSFFDEQLIEGLAGLEYNGGCWVLRTAIQRLATKETQSTDSYFIQLEFNGMGRIGSDPLNVLKHSIPGYRPVNEASPTF